MQRMSSADQPASRKKVTRQMLQMRLMRVRDRDARAIAMEMIDDA